MRTPVLILTAAAATLLAGHASPQDKANPSPKERADESAKRLKELRKERIATLKEVVSQSLHLYQAARLEAWQPMEDRMTLLRAEVEAAETEADRVALYTQAVDDLKKYAEVARARFEAGRGTESAALRIKAKRLEIEILLEQAKIKEAKGGK